jgi:HAD superfamily hydrolase (TIGR01484 family)
MNKKLLVFDLDDTLAVTKSPISDEMAETLGQVLNHFEVCVISGGKYEQFQLQVIDRLKLDADQLSKLHLMPTCGTRYYRFDPSSKDWALQYAEDLSEAQKKEIIKALKESAQELGYWEESPAGDIIEDRLSQITYSALGQKAKPEDKYKWDPDGSKKKALRDMVAAKLPKLEVRAGGSTSIDITRVGIDKAYGMQKLIDELDIAKDDILFFGDKLQEGGNDYPIKAMGIDSLEVDKWQDTVGRLQAILHVI